MRVRQALERFPFMSSLGLFWERVTASRITTIYFIFSIVNCVLQAVLQGEATALNARAASYLNSFVEQADATGDGFFVYNHHKLYYCDHVPSSISTDSCLMIWNGVPSARNGSSSNGTLSTTNMSTFNQSAMAGNAYDASATLTSAALSSLESAVAAFPFSSSGRTKITPSQIPSSDGVGDEGDSDDDNDEADDEGDDEADDEADNAESDGDDVDDEDAKPVVVGTSQRRDAEDHHVRVIKLVGGAEIVLNGYGNENSSVRVSNACLTAMNWPVQELENTKREDLAFLLFQFWLLGMSVVALLNESIPHIIASFVTHMSAAAWGAFQFSQTKRFHRNFETLITNGVCRVSFLPSYWQTRENVEIPSLALNSVGLFISMFLSWSLVKTFGWQTFKRVGASRTINHVYKLVLVLSVTIQLCLFFVIVSVALWLDQICNGAIARFALAKHIYEPVLIIVLIMLPVWLTTGWIAVRRELKIPMMVFLALSALYITGWGAMFDSTTFRWTISQWAFFAVIMVIGVVLVIVCLVVGVFCRLNFGRGLPHYLNAEEPLSGEGYTNETKDAEFNSEKIDFPSNSFPVPTFDAAFGSDEDMPPPNGARVLGPRFYMQQNAQFNVDSNQITGPAAVDVDRMSISDSSSATHVGSEGSGKKAWAPPFPLRRNNSTHSTASSRSGESFVSSTKVDPRWVIE